MKTKILLLVMITFCSVILISQNARKPDVRPNSNASIEKNNQLRTSNLKGTTNTGLNKILATDSLVAYGYVAYGGGGPDPLTKGPSFFNLDDPDSITLLAPWTEGDFISAGTWANGKWYGEEFVTGNLYEINPFDGSMTYIGTSGYNISGIAWDGTTMYGVSGNTLGSINLENGSGTVIGPMGTTGYMIALACDSAGNIYGADYVDDNFYSINKTTGAATLVGPLGIDIIDRAQDMEFDKDNDVLYLAGFVDYYGALYTINTSTGAATLVGDFMNGAQIDGFAIPYSDSTIFNDVGVVSILSPSSGMFLTDEEPIVVLINNFGSDDQSNFDVSCIVDGAFIIETVTDTIYGGETYEYTFTATLDLSEDGTYTINACTILDGDENPENNCTTKIVVNFDYCGASTQSKEELISFVLCGSINNASSWQGGVADYTDISTTIAPGNSEDISIINGDPYDKDSAAVWVDWNNDTIFQLNTDEEFILMNDGTNEFFTGSIDVPEGTAEGDYRMRIRLVWNESPNPCGPSDYGEIEDYTIKVPPTTNIDINLLIKTQVYPNPASDMVNIESDNLMKFVTIFNQTGQKVFDMELNSNFYRLNTSNFLSGVYYFLIKTDEGTVSRRILIK